MRILLLLAMAAGVSLVGAKCGGTGVGDPCTPEDEYLTGFPGFDVEEVNVESRSFQCETRVCLVNHFQGRVSCPYGQAEDPMGSGLSTCMGVVAKRNSPECQPGGVDHRHSCQVPDRDGSAWEDRIIPKVEAQLVERQAADAVYCSCRCGGPEGDESGATYCECPSGFICQPLVEDLGLGRGNLAGSYCVKEKTVFDPGDVDQTKCDSADPNCAKAYTLKLQSGSEGTNQDRACVPEGGTCREGDSCCKITRGVACKIGDNCFGQCTSITEGNASVPACQHLDAAGAPIPGALEVLYEIERSECKEGKEC